MIREELIRITKKLIYLSRRDDVWRVWHLDTKESESVLNEFRSRLFAKKIRKSLIAEIIKSPKIWTSNSSLLFGSYCLNYLYAYRTEILAWKSDTFRLMVSALEIQAKETPDFRLFNALAQCYARLEYEQRCAYKLSDSTKRAELMNENYKELRDNARQQASDAGFCEHYDRKEYAKWQVAAEKGYGRAALYLAIAASKQEISLSIETQRAYLLLAADQGTPIALKYLSRILDPLDAELCNYYYNYLTGFLPSTAAGFYYVNKLGFFYSASFHDAVQKELAVDTINTSLDNLLLAESQKSILALMNEEHPHFFSGALDTRMKSLHHKKQLLCRKTKITIKLTELVNSHLLPDLSNIVVAYAIDLNQINNDQVKIIKKMQEINVLTEVAELIQEDYLDILNAILLVDVNENQAAIIVRLHEILEKLYKDLTGDVISLQLAIQLKELKETFSEAYEQLRAINSLKEKGKPIGHAYFLYASKSKNFQPITIPKALQVFFDKYETELKPIIKTLQLLLPAHTNTTETQNILPSRDRQGASPLQMS